MYQTYVEWTLSYEASEILVFYVKMKFNKIISYIYEIE